MPLAMLLSSLLIVQAANADTKKPTISATDTKHQAALLVEIRKNLSQSGKFSPAVIDGVIAELRNKSMEEIKAIADFAGSNATGAERLIGPGVSQDARDRAGQLVGSSGSSSSINGSGAQRGVQSQLTGGGINDTRGQESVSKETCVACPGSSGRGMTASQATEEPTVETKPNGDVVTSYSDNSKSIVRGGKTEYVNSHGRVVDQNGRSGFLSWLLGGKKTPLPDDNNPSSGRLTFADQKRLGLIGSLVSEPDPNSTKGGTGGGVNESKANRTGTVGLYTESGTATYTSKADVQEIIRISVEKLQGPQVGQ
ncbi:MAG: hypothetical protein ABI858_00490 [Pseudoxanthomonas sp.]